MTTATEAAYREFRPLSFSIAYRMTGSASEAEDIVQDAFLRFHRAAENGTVIESPRAFVSTVTTRLAIDHMRSAKTRRESYFGPWLPEPVITSNNSEFERAERTDSLSLSFLVLLERLTPVERAVFLLREIFDYSYEEIAEIVGKSDTNCRQLFVRARKHIEETKKRFTATKEERQSLADRFFEAAQRGDLNSLVAFLSMEVAFYGDGGGKGRGLPQPVFGAEKVHRFLVTGIFGKFAQYGVRAERAEINGAPGALFFDVDNRLINAFVLEIGDGAIQTVLSIINPDKLTHLGYPLSPLATAG